MKLKSMQITLPIALLLFAFVLPISSADAAKKAAIFEQVIQGTVTDVDGLPLIGATVSVKSKSTVGTITDIDGNYKITVPDESTVLVFSYIGHLSVEETINGRSRIDVSLTPDISELSEVVVVGYGTQKKSDLTGSLVSAPLEDFEESPNTNILQSLAGSTPGISIGQVSAAGAEPDIQIRGQSSLNGNQNPLIILDGVYYRGRLSDLNPKDIASVDVLKDPSSKAVYGAQAANGVILITTKSGKSTQKPVISYAAYYSTQSPSNELTPKGRGEYLKGVRDIDWENGYTGPDFTSENQAWTVENNTGLFPPLLAGLANGTDYSWYDEVTNPGHITDHQLSVRGSSEQTSYFLSGGFTDQEGWMLNDVYQRITARVNVDVNVTDWLTLGANAFGSFSDYSGESPSLANIPQMSPLAAPRDDNGELIVNPLGDNRLNPFLQSASDDRDLRNNISGIFYAKVKLPIRGLNYRVNFSNNYRWDALSNSSIYDAGQSGRAIKINRSTYDLLLDNIITYSRQLTDDHGINLTLLYGINKINFDETRAEGTNFSNLALSYNSIEQAVIQQISSAAWEEDYLYQMARVSYDYRNKYLLMATVRRDGFSGFAENNKFGVFPSVGLGWVLSEESFMADSKLFSFLKIRASYGLNGNLTSRYSSLARVAAGSGSQYVFGDGGTTLNGQQISSLANPNLSWEKTAGINVGLDFSMFDSKLSGSIDYYESSTTDLLWNFVLPQITGFQNITSNVGEISNSGVEILLNAQPIRTKKFSWDLGLNLAANTNRIESLLGLDLDEDGREDDLIANGLFIGESIGAIYGYVVDGIYQVADMGNIPDGFAPGQYRLRDLNGDGQITPQDDRQILGRAEPAYELGLQNTLRYGDFTFKFFIKTIQGGSSGYLRENNPWASGYGTPGVAQSANWYSEIDYWSPANPNATYRLPGANAAIGGQRYFARNFIRLQDISLSYDLNEALVEKVGLQGLKVYISGKNLLTLTDWEGWDPETGQGFETRGNILPVMKGVSFGLTVSLQNQYQLSLVASAQLLHPEWVDIRSSTLRLTNQIDMNTSYKYLLFSLALLAILPACNEATFLEEEPLDFFSPSNSFVTFENFESSVFDLYAQVRSLRFSNSRSSNAHLYGTDIMFDARESNTNDRFGNYAITLNPTSGVPRFHWTRLYKIVTSANTIIDRLPDGDLSGDEQSLIEAEARFFRAYAYRNLVHLFGGVPLLLNEVTSPRTDFKRVSREEILAQVVEDFTAAVNGLPAIGEVADGRVSNVAAQHLLAEVYLAQQNWDQAIAATSAVIDDPNTALMNERFGTRAGEAGDVYYDLFRRGNQNRSGGNTEAIWVAQMEVDVPGGLLTSTGRAGNTLERQHAPASWTLQDPDGKAAVLGWRSDLNTGGRGVSFMQPTGFFENELWASDFSNDMRNSSFNYIRDFRYDKPESVWFDSSAVKYPGPNLLAQGWRWYPWLSKVTTPGNHPEALYANAELGLLTSGGGTTYTDQYYIRLAETYLLRAEAYLGKGSQDLAADDINVVRNRANAKPVLPGDVTIDFILDERARELSLEEERRITLHRLGKLVERVRKYNHHNADEIQDHHGLWPIPASEIEANITGDLQQNPGY